MRTTFRSPIVTVFGAIVSATFASSAHAEFKCDGRPLAHFDATACAHAAQGAESLRRFVTRTQAVYGLQMKDYARFVGDEETKRQPATSTAAIAKAPATK